MLKVETLTPVPFWNATGAEINPLRQRESPKTHLQQEEQALRGLTFKCKIKKKKKSPVSFVSEKVKYTPVVQSIPCLIFLMYVRTIQRLNYVGQKSKILFTVYDSDLPMALKKDEGHGALVDPNQGYNSAKLKNLA